MAPQQPPLSSVLALLAVFVRFPVVRHSVCLEVLAENDVEKSFSVFQNLFRLACHEVAALWGENLHQLIVWHHLLRTMRQFVFLPWLLIFFCLGENETLQHQIS